MVRLVPMSAEDLEVRLKQAIPEYAQDHVDSGNWAPEEALARSEKDFHELLPQGVATPNQHLFTILAEDGGGTDEPTERKVGMVWFAVAPKRARPSAWVYDFFVAPEYRRRGYGRAAFLAMEEKVRQLGLNRIELHVFGQNQGARALYESLGYEVTNVMMAKRLA